MRPTNRSVSLTRVTLASFVLALTGGAAVVVPAEATTTTTVTVRDAGDAFVTSAHPHTNYGSSTVLRTRSTSPTNDSYLKFTVSGVSGTITRAVLRLYTVDSDAAGYAVRRVASSRWRQTAITWANAPARGSVVVTHGRHGHGVWTAVNVTSAIHTNGTFSLAVTPRDRVNVRYGSRESGHAPRLVLTVSHSSSTSSTTTSTTSSSPNVAPKPSEIQALLDRKDFIYGSEIGAWRDNGGPAVNPSTGIPSLVQAAEIPVVRFAQYDTFTDMKDPAGNPGTETRANFDAAINGIINNLHAVPFIKLLPIHGRDLIGSKAGTLYCPPLNNLTMDLPYYKAIVAQAGSRVRMYESSNEMEYDCATSTWGFSSAGASGVSKTLGEHYAQNMPALKKYARSLGFNILTVGYVGISGGTGWGNSVSSPNTRSMTDFMTAVHNAYVAHGNDPDYIPDAVSIHAYPYSPDFSSTASLSSIISYFDNWTSANRAVINRIWGTTIGSRIKLVVSEWNAGIDTWSGFGDSRVNDFYTAWLHMLRRDGFWMANCFALASNDTQPFDMIREDGTTRRQYATFKSVSVNDTAR